MKSNMEVSNEEPKYKEYLYFAYKKAKHFVTRETTFVDHTDILLFEGNLDENINRLEELLENPKELLEQVKKMQGELYFIPKSFGPQNEPRVRPKVSFPFEYQVLWAAVILIIGEWFDTNEKVKNTYSICNQSIRNQFDWMVPWSYNGRIKRLKDEANFNSGDEKFTAEYIHYNSSKLYESHQMALRKFEQHRIQTINEMLFNQKKIYQGELDIKEFYPTLDVENIQSAIEDRLKVLEEIKGFNIYFDVNHIRRILDALFKLTIVYPDKDMFNEDDDFRRILVDYYKKLNPQFETNPQIHNLVEFLNKTLPLDLIASDFLSNCTLNYFVDKKIEKEFKQEFIDKKVSILRYTDDYLVIGSDKNLVVKVITSIKQKLASIGLRESPMKTLPTSKKDIKKQLEEAVKNQGLAQEIIKYVEEQLPAEISELDRPEKQDMKKLLSTFKVKIEPEEITRKCTEVSYFSKNLSTTADMKLQALSDEGLELFMQEMLVFLQTDNDIGEIKEETIKVFAAWRLSASYREKSYRMNENQTDLDLFLCTIKEAIQKYPYKMAFYDVYLLTIFNMIEKENKGLEKLEDFLVNLPSYIKSSDKGKTVYQIYFGAVRERVLGSLSDNWYRFNEKQRNIIRRIIEQAFLVWYANPKIQWTEQYILYWVMAILRIRLPLHLCMAKQENYPSYLQLLNKIYRKYFFITQDIPMEDEERPDIELNVVLNMFSKGLYWNKRKKCYLFNEVDEIIYNVIEKEVLSNSKPDVVNWLSFVKISHEKLSVKHLENLEEIEKAIDIEETGAKADSERSLKNEVYYDVLDFLQSCIKKYFENPKKYNAIYKWVKLTARKDEVKDNFISDYKKYVSNRFRSYAKIRSYYALTDINLPVLPMIETIGNEKIPIADWVFYCEMMPYNLETIPSKQEVLHPLTEYEYVKLLRKIIVKHSGENDPLFHIELSFESWRKIRNEKKWKDEINETNDARVKEESNMDENLPDEISQIQTKEYVKALFAMLTNRPNHVHIKKHFSMYKWNDLQSYFKMAYYPSTKVANLFVNNLNIHQEFYRKVYHMPLEELPYGGISSNNTGKDISKWINDYLDRIEEELIRKKYNRQLELLEIDIDQLRG